ncbi:MAG: hypothetical protein HOG46_04250 [Gammaproteobacteria bacterium]|jgi:hypothetical protein|nr:hypothetical protein [Gammaproteobacteria bacterium]MBT5213493.1 hypothetical protein [Pelagibacteraceae bacterium]MBT6447127.1 hypothetical protein [Flavobacteriaceae bacterium]
MKFDTNNVFKLSLLITVLSTQLLLSQTRKIELKVQSYPEIADFWWLEKNNYGIMPNSFFSEFNFKLKKSNADYKVDFYLHDGNAYLSESFIKYNFTDNTFLRFGKYYKDFSKYFNDDISSGHLLVSNNAKPMKKIGFVSSKKIRKAHFDFGIAHGVFDKNNLYIKPPLLHEKFINMNIKKNDYTIGIGLIHEAMWGGTVDSEDGQQQSKFKDFLKIFISADGPLLEGDPHANSLGNHLGVWEFFLEKRIGIKNIRFYHQHIFEDTSGLRFANKFDGLWGVEIENFLSKSTLLLEYLETTYQNIDPPYVDEAYYNHWIYDYGWSYKGQNIGNPFINSLEVVPIQVFHIGSEGVIGSNYYYKIMLSKNVNKHDYIKYKIQLNKKIKNTLDINVAVLNNQNNVGITFGLSWKLK